MPLTLLTSKQLNTINIQRLCPSLAIAPIHTYGATSKLYVDWMNSSPRKEPL